MNKNDAQWESFYHKTSGRPPRALLVDVLKLFGQKTFESPPKAIDLGSGDGTETAFLLANGWRVLAIDREPAAFKSLSAKISPEVQECLQIQIANFEVIELSPADLIYAGYSVPFCHPQHFDTLWKKIVDNINPEGRFAGQLFGVRDSWVINADMTFFTLEEVRDLFTEFEVEHFREEDEDGDSNVGPKHWHIFHIIARKK